MTPQNTIGAAGMDYHGKPQTADDIEREARNKVRKEVEEWHDKGYEQAHALEMQELLDAFAKSADKGIQCEGYYADWKDFSLSVDWLQVANVKLFASLAATKVMKERVNVEDFQRLARVYQHGQEIFKKDRDRLNKEHSVINEEASHRTAEEIFADWDKWNTLRHQGRCEEEHFTLKEIKAKYLGKKEVVKND